MTHRDDGRHRTSRDPVSRYFAERGVSAAVQRRGLRGIIAQWQAIASTAANYDLTLDDWLNDVDLRDIIAGAMAVAPQHERQHVCGALETADAAFRSATLESARAVCGAAGEYDRERQWWYFRRPAQPGETMRTDLVAAGILG